jgi:hypothetical protein
VPICLFAYAQEKAAGQGSQQAKTAAERNKLHAPWDPKDMDKLRKEVGLIGPGTQAPFPTASFPGYLKKPEALAELMPQAQHAVSQKGGRTPLGLVDPGDIVLIPLPHNADPTVQEAIKEAFKARKVEVRLLYEHELAGIAKEDLEALDKVQNVFKAGDGQQELNFLNSTGLIPDWDAAKKWTREKDPVLANATWPSLKYPNERVEQLAKTHTKLKQDAILKYLDQHPEVNKIFWGTGGRPYRIQDLKHHGKKFVGNYTYLNIFDIMSRVPAYPSDVWRMIEHKMIEPLGYVDRVEVTDPEGTALSFDVSAEQAKSWGQGAYLQGHLFMIPSQASGVYPFSVIQYPALGDKWLPTIQMTTANGYIASTNSHASNHPRMQIKIKNGYVQEVKGGGLYGDGFRLWLSYPKINELTWPHHKNPGFWWLFEAGTATNPKYFKHPGEIMVGNNMSERNAGGVIHWSFGAEVTMGPESGKEKAATSPKTLAFGKEHGVPVGHAMHNHTLLPTYQIRFRDSGKWSTVIEHGQIMAGKDPEVRALASRYGNPEELLRRDWTPEIPGITAPGNYNKDYGSDPGAFWTKWAKSVYEGTNPYIGK